MQPPWTGILLAAAIFAFAFCNPTQHYHDNAELDWLDPINNNANSYPKTKANRFTDNNAPYTMGLTDEIKEQDDSAGKNYEAIIRNRFDLHRNDYSDEIVNDVTDLDDAKHYSGVDASLGDGKYDLNQVERLLITKLRAMYLEEFVQTFREKRFGEKLDVGDAANVTRSQPKITDHPYSEELYMSPVKKRIFKLWTRHEGFPNARKDFAHRRHFHQWLNGDFVSAETRTPQLRPPGSPLRWG